MNINEKKIVENTQFTSSLLGYCADLNTTNLISQKEQQQHKQKMPRHSE